MGKRRIGIGRIFMLTGHRRYSSAGPMKEEKLLEEIEMHR